MSHYSSLLSMATFAPTSSPIASTGLDLLSFDRPSSRASNSSSSSSGVVYVPVHRRKVSNTISGSPGSSGSSVSSAPPSPASSLSSFASADAPMYSVEDLLLMSHSPLARLADAERSHMREVAPEIYLSRKQRSRMEGRGKHTAESKFSRSAREGRRSNANSWRT
ncbi:hypothetical protein FIBSPDRAFT_957634 [Athelia psychrophila]|uniref:Uncharacterized protein n=1 Tax=Athelia psychrophila TaxID=1759441 RepID=A0A166FLB3_9AGAM|nr:hypothetical protein FIBSPDRAFT_957634 [Fibularhizoctonia sp. CBS 109695]